MAALPLLRRNCYQLRHAALLASAAQRRSVSGLPLRDESPVLGTCGVEPFSDAFKANTRAMDASIAALDAGVDRGVHAGDAEAIGSSGRRPAAPACTRLPAHIRPPFSSAALQTSRICCRQAAPRRCSGTASAASCCRGVRTPCWLLFDLFHCQLYTLLGKSLNCRRCGLPARPHAAQGVPWWDAPRIAGVARRRSPNAC